MHTDSKPSAFIIIIAFAAVYLIWGSTYLGIAVALTSIPPMILGGSRFLIAGVLLFVWCYFFRKERTVFRDWRENGVLGVLMIFGGNGAVVWVEQYLPSGLVAVAVASMPIWLAVLDKPNWKYTFSKAMPIAGLVVGFAGVVFLFSNGEKLIIANSPQALISFPILMLGTISWAIGTLYSKRLKSNTPVFMRVSIQMILGGLAYAMAGIISGEWNSFDPRGIHLQSLLSLLYLIVFGSLIAYLAYIWLLTVRPAAQVGTYAYVNPAVAVFLGWLLIGEQIYASTLVALSLILLGVVLINISYQREK